MTNSVVQKVNIVRNELRVETEKICYTENRSTRD